MSATVQPHLATAPVQSATPPPAGRLGPRGLNTIKALLGLPPQRRLAKGGLLVEAIRQQESQLLKLTDVELRQIAMKMRGRARGGENLDRLLPEAFGLVSVAAQRTLQVRPFDVQLAGAYVMHKGGLAELATGEGKTLSASLPAFLNSLTGKGVHVTTVNDYLARRDAEWIGPIYQVLGLTVGVLQMKMSDADRTQAYRCDITYGTASEFGFDFLRDRLRIRSGRGGLNPFWEPWNAGAGFAKPMDPRVQRDLNYAIVDEADSIFIDEAKTPLIISAATRQATKEEQVVYLWADQLGAGMKLDGHYTFDQKKNKVELTEEGKQLIRWSNPPTGPHSHAMDKLHEHVERAITAHHRFRLDQHYMIENNKIVIIDEYTGRRMPDRHWREGLHQAVEAKEGVPITFAADHAAQITYQTYFRLYKKLAGMTGTAFQNFWEILRVYRLWVTCVPTNRPAHRTVLPDRVYPTEQAKFDAIVAEIKERHERGQPLLVGTRSVEKSEKLSERLQKAGIKHKVLNAKQHEMEAKVVAEAGQPGKVTIATNMAGRGTDIKLGPGVAELGGLHVLGTERHEATRIDRQLVGRAARQGDPGSCQFFLSLEDELLEALGPSYQEYLRELGRQGGNRDWDQYRGVFLRAQRKMEAKHFRQRVDLLYYEKNRQETLKDLSADPYVD